jgi:hypothetical protein
MSWLTDADETIYDHEPAHGLTSFDDWRVRVFVPWTLLGLAWAINASPLQFFLRGFHVWMHELGHASAAWMTGQKASPLPIGWTSIEPGYSPTVYFGGLLLFGVLGWAGWTQRRPAAVAVALVGAAAQYWMTWRNTAHTHDLWVVFGGVGGEFYLSAGFMAFFFVRMPAKFRWGACRYLVFFIAASTLLVRHLEWMQIYRGSEDIPWGTMLHGEEDAGGDMNRLMDDHGWTQLEIRSRFHLLGQGCLTALAVMYLWFAVRADHALVQLYRREPS